MDTHTFEVDVLQGFDLGLGCNTVHLIGQGHILNVPPGAKAGRHADSLVAQVPDPQMQI